MSYNTTSNRTYQPAFQRRVKEQDTEAPARFPGAFQSQKRSSNDETRPNRAEFPGAFQNQRQPQNQERGTQRADFPGAFQQKKREYEPRVGASGYRSWKQSEQVAKAKPMDLNSTEDFPTLGGSTVVKATQQQGASLAEKLKTVIQQEQDEATHRRYQKDTARKEDDAVFVIPMSTHWQRTQREKKQAMEAKQREIDEEEKRYRWQISSEITPDEDDETEQDYNDADYEQEEDQTCYDKNIDN